MVILILILTHQQGTSVALNTGQKTNSFWEPSPTPLQENATVDTCCPVVAQGKHLWSQPVDRGRKGYWEIVITLSLRKKAWEQTVFCFVLSTCKPHTIFGAVAKWDF